MFSSQVLRITSSFHLSLFTLLAPKIFWPNFVFQQKLLRLQDSKAVEEKAAKIKEWVMLKLSEVHLHVYQLQRIPKQHRAE